MLPIVSTGKYWILAARQAVTNVLTHVHTPTQRISGKLIRSGFLPTCCTAARGWWVNAIKQGSRIRCMGDTFWGRSWYQIINGILLCVMWCTPWWLQVADCMYWEKLHRISPQPLDLTYTCWYSFWCVQIQNYTCLVFTKLKFDGQKNNIGVYHLKIFMERVYIVNTLIATWWYYNHL